MARALTLTALLSAVFVVFMCMAVSAYAAEDLKASRERLCGSNTDCLTVVVVEEVPVESPSPTGGDLDSSDPAIAAALKAQEEKDAAAGKKKKNVKRVARSFLKIDKIFFKTDTIVQLVDRMPEWFGPRPSKFVFRGKDVPIAKRLSRFNPRLNEKIIMIKADEDDDKEYVVPKTKEASPDNFDL